MIEGAVSSEVVDLQLAQAQARASQLEKHLVFIGFMGAGKSTFAALTATRLKRQAFDSDVEVVKRAGRTIEDLFASGEELYFRRMEREVIGDLLDLPPAVIALGGGALQDRELRQLVFARSFVINLAVSWRDIEHALPELQRTRPLLRNRSRAEIHHLFLRRQHTYRQAHMRIQMPRGDPSATVQDLLAALRSDGS